MTFDIEIIIRTKAMGAPLASVPRTEMVESAVVTVEAAKYSEALERTFVALKTCNTFVEFMDKVNLNGVKYDGKQNTSE